SISHGKAVAVGMAYESLVSALMGLSSYDVHREIVEMLKMYGLPASLRDLGIELPRDPSTLKSVVARDKKAGWRGLTIPIVTEVGRWRSVTVDVDSYVEALVKCFG
ncbi:MAG: 3-dehydroquinate synthase, partial [Ignisphaera sp.]